MAVEVKVFQTTLLLYVVRDVHDIAMEMDTPTSEVQVATGSSASANAPASAEASVSVGVSAAVEAPVSVRTVPTGTGTSGKGGGGWKEAAGKKKKKKKGGSKPRGAVSLAYLNSELSAISLGESQGQVVDVEAMEVTVGGDRGVGATSPGGPEKERLPSRLRLPRASDPRSMLISIWIRW